MVFTPIAIGSVHVWTFSVMELAVAALVLTWMVKMLCLKDKHFEESSRDIHDQVCKIPRNRFGFIKTPLNIPFLLFIGVVTLQVIPLPESAIRSLSPKTLEIYNNYLPAGEEDRFTSHLSSLKPGKRLRGEEVKRLRGGEGEGGGRFTLSINPHSTRKELFKILAYVAVFFLIVNNLKTRRAINLLILAIILVGCFEAVYGFYKYSTGILMPHAHHADRLTGTYVNANHLAGFLEMVIPIAIAFAVCGKEGLFFKNGKSSSHGRGRLSPDTEGLPFRARLSLLFNKENFANILLYILVVLLVGALFLSQSRMGAIGLLTSIWIFAIYILIKSYRKRGTVVAVSVLLGLISLASWMGLGPLYNRFSSTDELSIRSRTDIWKDAGGIVRDFPLLGTGKGTFIDIYQKYKTIPRQLTYDHAHNDYLELLTDLGFLGLAVTVIGGGIFIGKTINQLTKKKTHDAYASNVSVGLLCSIAAIIVHSTTDFNMFITANALMFTTILALLTLTSRLRDTSGEKERSSSTPSKAHKLSVLRKPLYAIIIFLTISVSVPVIDTYTADIYHKRAKGLEASPQPNPPLSIQYMQESISLDETNSAYHFDLGRTYLQLSRTQSDPEGFERNAILAAERFEDAITHNPCHSLAHLTLGMVYNTYRDNLAITGLDKFIQAERSHLRKALDINPSNASINYLTGALYVHDWNTLLEEDKEYALKHLKTAIELNPEYLNKALQASWEYIQDYNQIKKILPDTPDNYMTLATFFDGKDLHDERDIAWQDSRRKSGNPYLPSIFEADNLLVNGNFEYEPGTAWDDWEVRRVEGAAAGVVSAESVEGGKSLQILFDGTKDVPFQHVTQTVRVRGGASYRLTGHIKTRVLTSNSGLIVRITCKDERAETEPYSGTREWERFALEIEVPEDCDTLNVMIYRRGLGTVKKETISGVAWIDTLHLTPTK